jgi:hypothetical protein
VTADETQTSWHTDVGASLRVVSVPIGGGVEDAADHLAVGDDIAIVHSPDESETEARLRMSGSAYCGYRPSPRTRLKGCNSRSRGKRDGEQFAVMSPRYSPLHKAASNGGVQNRSNRGAYK